MVMCAAATAATAAYASAGISKGISLLSVKLVFEIGRPQAKATRSRANTMLTCNSAQTRLLAFKVLHLRTTEHLTFLPDRP